MSERDYREALARAEAELAAFKQSCRQAGFGDRDMEELCRPFSDVERKTSLRFLFRLAVATVSLVAIVCSVGRLESVQWHASALARIVIIKALPFYDWRYLFFESCLLEKTSFREENFSSLRTLDCAVCEAVDSVQRLSETSYDAILNEHLIRGAPVIVTDANSDWPRREDANLTRLLHEDERLRESVPCALHTNLRTGHQSGELGHLLRKLSEARVPTWFVHFQNCDLNAVKSLRALAPRPYFLSPHVPPAHFNWLLMSDKYPSPAFKRLELDAGLIALAQLDGAVVVRLEPRSPCETACPTLSFDVRKGDTLVLANSMWNFDYLPDESSFNAAVLTETAWNEA